MKPCLEWAHLLPLAPEELTEPGLAQSLALHLGDCADCSTRQSLYAGVRTATRATATRHPAPRLLQDRIAAALAPPPAATAVTATPSPPGRGFWIGLAGGWLAAGALACALAVSLLLGPVPWNARQAPSTLALDNTAAYIDNHARALVTQHLVDVDSSSRHTVKPWFRGRLDYAPPVPDLAPQGYPLVGGRLDYVDHRSVAVLVYRRRQHVIDVYVWPAAAPAPASTSAAPPGRERGSLGYHSVAGNAAGMSYVAVSDLDPVELADLGRIFAQDLQTQATGGTLQ